MKQNQNWTVTVLGTRGAFPVAAADFLEYGGNTSCVCVDCGELVVLDAGTGILRLGKALARQGGHKRVHILISHVHLDHILGLVGFSLFGNPEAEIHLYGEARDGMSLRKQLDRLFGPPYWPVGLENFRAKTVLHEIGPDQEFYLMEGVSVRTLRSSHPNQSLIYRLDGAGRSLVYTLDCEWTEEMGARLAEFARDCSLLIWDANFAPGDLMPGWGHSTWEQGIAVREAARAKEVLMTHFSNTYTDAFLREQEKLALERDAAARFAQEGMVISL